MVIKRYQMAIKKKNSRCIICNGIKFRWTISPGSHFVNFVAEGEGKGRKIEVLVESGINRFWTEFSDVSDLNLRVIMPRDAASFILKALDDGWNPEEKGKSIKYRLLADRLLKEE